MFQGGRWTHLSKEKTFPKEHKHFLEDVAFSEEPNQVAPNESDLEKTLKWSKDSNLRSPK